MTSRTALVTGASSGIGEATAVKLHELGYNVYGAARRARSLDDAAAAGVIPLAMDVSRDESIRAGVGQVIAETGRIDVLVDSAGYGSYGAVEDVSMDEVRRQAEVNVFGAGGAERLPAPGDQALRHRRRHRRTRQHPDRGQHRHGRRTPGSLRGGPLRRPGRGRPGRVELGGERPARVPAVRHRGRDRRGRHRTHAQDPLRRRVRRPPPDHPARHGLGPHVRLPDEPGHRHPQAASSLISPLRPVTLSHVPTGDGLSPLRLQIDRMGEDRRLADGVGGRRRGMPEPSVADRLPLYSGVRVPLRRAQRLLEVDRITEERHRA
ncbi:SDR family NAD(P)-dependent oxidoreductase [Streptomyces sp. NPDC002328]|uniref:SDR family NAD(P)-dependent oxidoreductase n=1 Tax=Streptomyces sp. NPDC002328 TaxID=3364642 RepID=UPI003695534B